MRDDRALQIDSFRIPYYHATTPGGPMPKPEPLAQLPLLRRPGCRRVLGRGRAASNASSFPRAGILEEEYIGLKLYVLVEGRVNLPAPWAGPSCSSTRWAPRKTFGEISVIDGGPASATVEAETDVVALGLQKDDFYELVDGSPTLGRKVYRNLLDTCARGSAPRRTRSRTTSPSTRPSARTKTSGSSTSSYASEPEKQEAQSRRSHPGRGDGGGRRGAGLCITRDIPEVDSLQFATPAS